MRRTLWVSVLVFISMLAFPAPGAGQVKIKKPSVPSAPKVEIAPASAAAAEPAAGQPAEAPAASEAAPAAASAAGPGEGAWVNFDFQPGERPLYVDDFSTEQVGNFPRRLEFETGNMEVAEWNGSRYLRATTRYARFSVILPEVLPERFSIELDATPSVANISATIKFAPDAPSFVSFNYLNTMMQGGIDGTGPTAKGSTPPLSPQALFRLRVMADGRYVKVYINDTRVANVPNADLGRSDRITFELSGTETEPVFMGNISIMAGGRQLYDVLVAEGRVATQGIYFDSGSDHVRPESSATLAEIARMLTEHGDLALLIEGHTDDVGNAAFNQDLSERRAAAVATVLVETYGIDGARLTTAGFGPSNPIAPNTTPEGRQANRRVELVKV